MDQCSICQRKLKLSDLVCKCDKRFCRFHKFPEQHDCTFDYKNEQRKILEKNNPLIMPQKVCL